MRKSTNAFRLLAIGILLMFTLIRPAQSGAAAALGTDKEEHSQGSVPAVEEHLKLLADKLDLSVEQQAKMRPILHQMFDEGQKLTQDTSLSSEAREEKERAVHEKASKRARKLLNDEQKEKLDQLEQEHHSGK
jgi:hypothetical protein